jgi:hypothetical protein
MSIEMTEGVHKCPHCGRRQHALVIGLDRDGRILRCKQCGERFRPLAPAEAAQRERERKRRWCTEHPEYAREYKRRYRSEHLEEMREKERRYRSRNRERINELNRAWRDAHVEQERERNRLYYREHRESINLAKAYRKLYGAREVDE